MRRPHPAPRRGAGLLAALLAGATLAVACGLPVDEQPEAISRDALPDALLPSSTTTSTQSDETTEVFIYLTKQEGGSDDELAVRRVRIRAQDPAHLAHDVLRHLVDVEPSPEHAADGLINNVPRRTQILSVVHPEDRPGLVVVDLAGLGEVEGAKLRLAVAQLVFTLTELPDVDRVQIMLEGESVSLPTEGGTTTNAPMTRANFQRLYDRLLGVSPTSTSTTIAVLPPDFPIPPPEDAQPVP